MKIFFRGEGKSFVRMNIGCPEEILEKQCRGMSRFIIALENEAI